MVDKSQFSDQDITRLLRAEFTSADPWRPDLGFVSDAGRRPNWTRVAGVALATCAVVAGTALSASVLSKEDVSSPRPASQPASTAPLDSEDAVPPQPLTDAQGAALTDAVELPEQYRLSVGLYFDPAAQVVVFHVPVQHESSANASSRQEELQYALDAAADQLGLPSVPAQVVPVSGDPGVMLNGAG